MANIKLQVGYPIKDGAGFTFHAPCNCSSVEGITVQHPGGTQRFCFKDAHGNDLTGTNNLFAAGSLVKVVLDVTNSAAFIQNADTNGYLEQNIRSVRQEVAAERARIDQFTALEEGSTTGDAELMDLRVDHKGRTWASAGESVRSVTGELDAAFIVDEGTNLLNPDEIQSASGYGELDWDDENDSWFSGYIPVVSGDILTVQYKDSTTAERVLATIDSVRYSDSAKANETDYNVLNATQVTIPAGYFHVRLWYTLPVDAAEVAVVKSADIVPFEEYHEPIRTLKPECLPDSANPELEAQVASLEERVDALEENEVEGAVLYTAQTLTEEQKAQARANIGAGAGGSMEIPDGSITPEKTNFTETVIGKNLVNPATLTAGGLQADGSVITVDSWANYKTSDFIRIDGEKHIVAVIDKVAGALYTTRIITALYDADHNIIAGSYINDNTGNSRIIDNADAVYLRVTVGVDNFNSTYIGTQVEKGDTPTAWEAYKETVYSTLKVHAKDIDPAVVTVEKVGDAVNPAVQAELQSVFFAEPKNLFHDAELVEGYMANGAAMSATASYNTFVSPTLSAGVTYGIYPRCRFVVNALTNTNISSQDVNGEFTFTLEQDAPVKVSFLVRYTEKMLLYNADLYTYEDVEKRNQNILDTDKVIVPRDTAHGNILLGKKWAVCGDSFSEVVSTTTEDSYIVGGPYDGQKKSYGYIIANRNDMEIQHLAAGGKTLAYPADGSFHNSFTDVSGSAPNNYTSIAEDVDYITLYFGINDSHHESGTSGTDGEDVTGVIPLGTIDDADNTSFCGAWNVCLEWLIKNRPFAHIGIIVSNGCDRDEYRTATIAAANKWGVPYIDLNGDERTPMMLRSTNPAYSSVAKAERLKAQAISYGENHHPNAKALEYESTFIEAWLRTL